MLKDVDVDILRKYFYRYRDFQRMNRSNFFQANNVCDFDVLSKDIFVSLLYVRVDECYLLIVIIIGRVRQKNKQTQACMVHSSHNNKSRDMATSSVLCTYKLRKFPFMTFHINFSNRNRTKDTSDSVFFFSACAYVLIIKLDL